MNGCERATVKGDGGLDSELFSRFAGKVLLVLAEVVESFEIVVEVQGDFARRTFPNGD